MNTALPGPSEVKMNFTDVQFTGVGCRSVLGERKHSNLWWSFRII